MYARRVLNHGTQSGEALLRSKGEGGDLFFSRNSNHKGQEEEKPEGEGSLTRSEAT